MSETRTAPDPYDSHDADLPPEVEERLKTVVEQFVEALEAGEEPDPRAVVDAHPDIAELLEERLEVALALHRAGRSSGER
jgi:hypothetical protein